MSKFVESALKRAKLLASELRVSPPVFAALLLFGVIDFTNRVLPTEFSVDAPERAVEMPEVNYRNHLADEYLQLYKEKLDSMRTIGDASVIPLAEDSPGEKVAEAQEAIDRSELELIGIFRGDAIFAVIKQFIDDDGSYELKKVTLGAKIQGLTVLSITNREVKLVGNADYVKILRLFDLSGKM